MVASEQIFPLLHIKGLLVSETDLNLAFINSPAIAMIINRVVGEGRNFLDM